MALWGSSLDSEIYCPVTMTMLLRFAQSLCLPCRMVRTEGQNVAHYSTGQGFAVTDTKHLKPCLLEYNFFFKTQLLKPHP